MATPASVTVGASERSAVSDLSSSPAASASPPTVTDAVSLAAAAVQELTGALEAAKELAAKASASRELAERAALREHEAQEVEDAVRADVDASFPTVGAAEEQRRREVEAEEAARKAREAEAAQRMRERDEAERAREDAERMREARGLLNFGAGARPKRLADFMKEKRMGAEAGKPLFGPDSSTALGESAARQEVAALAAAERAERREREAAERAARGEGSASASREERTSNTSEGGGSASGRRGWADADSDDDDFFSKGPSFAPNEGYEWRRKQAVEPKYEPAPTPEVSAWSRPIMVMKREPAAGEWATGVPHVYDEGGGSGVAEREYREESRQQASDDWRQRAPPGHTWGLQAEGGGGGAGPTLLQIQAQQEGGNEAKEKMAQLTAMGFPLAPAADALLRTGGDVSAAVALLTSEGGSAEERRAAAAAAAAAEWKPKMMLRPEGAPPPKELVEEKRQISWGTRRPKDGEVAPSPPTRPAPPDASDATPPRRLAEPPPPSQPRILLPPRGGGAGAHSASPPSSPAAPPAAPPYGGAHGRAPNPWDPPPAAQPRVLVRRSPPAGSPAGGAHAHAAVRPMAPLPPAYAAPPPRGPPGGGGGGGGGGGTMADKLKSIRQELVIDAALPMAAAIKQANDTMGLPSQGPLPQQVAALVAALGIRV